MANELGTQQLGTSKFGAVTEVPADLTAGQTPRERFDGWVKSAFPTDEGTNWDAFLNTLADEFTTELSVRQQMWLQQYVDTATGAQLDKIGGLFDLDRHQDEPDYHYRRRIKLQLPKYTSGATIEDVLSVSAHLLNCDAKHLELRETFEVEPARFDIFIPEQIINAVPVTVDEYESMLQSIKAGGVKANAVIGAQFSYRSKYAADNNINDPDKGYASADGSVEGAPYADIITAMHTGPDEERETTVGNVGFGEGGFGLGGFGE